jgi:chaperone required for assembly of F1-ATPase
MKRFWKTVAIVDGVIELDGRPVRTPARAPLLLPTPQLAEAVADEWRNVGEELDPRAMPLTGLANAAIDQIAPNPAPFAADLARYGESDLLCYRAELPAPLVARQAAQWDPLLDWARTRYDVHFETTAGIMHRAQPPATIARLQEAVAALDPFQLAALSPLVTISGSLVAALALLEGAADRETVWRAAQLDEDWQAEQWGEDELATRARRVREADFDAGVRFLGLL